MSAVLEFVQARGEYASLLAVALLLWLSAGATARLLALRRDEVTELFFNGAIAFVVAGRLAYIVVESPQTLLDPLVLIRIQAGIEPLAGAAGAAAVVLRHGRGGEGAWAWVGAGAAGLAIATVGYDLACVARDACYGAVAPAPLGFEMSGFGEPRVATPLVEAAILLAAGAALLASLRRLRLEAAALLLIAVLALVRAALTPASVLGRDAVGLETMLLVATGLVALAGSVIMARPNVGPSGAANPESGADDSSAARAGAEGDF